MMKAFLICPVRGHSPEETWPIVEALEGRGWVVHWPHRDTDQNDPTGLRICRDNREAIDRADRVFIVWDGQSTGSLFDLGIAFALHKPLGLIQIPAASEGKSFQNMMREWAKTGCA